MSIEDLPPPNKSMSFTPTIHNTSYPYIDPSKYSLHGKSVLITGASRGCGRAMAIGYAKAGISQLALAARSPISTEEILEAAKSAGRPEPKILTLKFSVTDRSEIETAAKLVEEQFGKLDILINNAGYLGNFEPILDSDPDDWWSNWETNIKGIYLVSRAFIRLLLKSELKTVINITSEGANVLLKGASGYMSTKMANLRLSQFLSLDYDEQGLLAYSVNPGGVHTDLGHNMPEYLWGPILVDEPDLCGESIPWLTSQKRDWLAGRYVSCTWDMKELDERKDEIVKNDLLKLRLAVTPGQ
ncbi:MAG: putative secondary metabolism biosynthetic enzyme [Bathelium mastoideum]|nr:MAG: putative secondary metabolism biosynthetic enzyme [Bathelium mastoideum]KAI9690817.1 MAG: putative secondary metabolism biosynthetic enzyme [Bathelium mastoideum]